MMLVGSYDECLNTKYEEKVQNSTIEGKYCTAIIDNAEHQNKGDFLDKDSVQGIKMSYGVCIPSVCTEDDLNGISGYITKTLGIPFYFHFHEELCDFSEKNQVSLATRISLYIGSGPFWTFINYFFIDYCKENWWSTLLYVQNFVHPNNMCIGQSWYLAVDTQLFVLAPFLLYLVGKKPNWAIALLTLLVLVSCGSTFGISWLEEVGPAVIGYGIAFSLGMTYILWILPMPLMTGVIIYNDLRFTGKEAASVLEYSVYNSLCRLIWSIGICIIIFLCDTGYGVWQVPNKMIAKFLGLLILCATSVKGDVLGNQWRFVGKELVIDGELGEGLENVSLVEGIEKFHKGLLDCLRIEKANIFGGCKDQLLEICSNQTSIGIQMLDAASKIPSGLMEASRFDLGNFDECVAIDYDYTKGRILGKYCAAGLVIPDLKNITNADKVLQTTEGNREQIEVFHGMKTISMMWVIAGHGFVGFTNFPVTNYNYGIKWQTHDLYVFYITSAPLAVDTFFYMSGFLLAYHYFKVKHNSAMVQIKSVPLLYIHRYLRITPAVIMLYLSSMYLLPYLGSGPIYKNTCKELTDTCQSNWWSLLLYIQNYYNYDNLAASLVIWAAILLGMLATCICYQAVEMQNDYVNKTVFYSLMRPAWCIGLSWIVYSSYYGYGGIVNWFLGRPIFQVCGKLSYSIYLVHGIVIAHYVIMMRVRVHFSEFIEFYLWCAYFMISMIVAFLWTLAFESPMITVEKFIFGGLAKKVSCFISVGSVIGTNNTNNMLPIVQIITSVLNEVAQGLPDLSLVCDLGFGALGIRNRCAEQLAQVCRNKSVALRFLDAWSKFPYSGMLPSNRFDLGHYDECINTEFEYEDEKIVGKHCFAGLIIPDPTNISDLNLAFKLSTCLPDKCSSADITKIASAFVKDFPPIIRDEFCTTKETGKDLTIINIVVIVFDTHSRLIDYFLGMMLGIFFRKRMHVPFLYFVRAKHRSMLKCFKDQQLKRITMFYPEAHGVLGCAGLFTPVIMDMEYYLFCGHYLTTLACSVLWTLAFESPILAIEKVLFTRKPATAKNDSKE
nr:unnamed protein product [Callosobruchus analis]